MIIGTIRILPLPERRADVLEVFQAIQEPVLAQPGCVGCSVYEELGLEHAILIVERWESLEALSTHIRSKVYRQILGAIELSRSPPEVRFDHVSTTEGMELIERLRRHGETSAVG